MEKEKTMVNIEIDGKMLCAEDGSSVLETALQNGIYIPHLCHHPDLRKHESCRLCVVEQVGVEGVSPSCSMTVKDGMSIRTKSEAINKVRNLAMELLLAAHPEDCSTCPKYGRCELQTLIQYMNVSSARMRTRTKGIKSVEHPLLIHDMNRCILCGRCVRACNDLRGVKVLQVNKKGLEAYVGTLHDRLLKDAGCRFCGACAEVCPTGTIRDRMNYTAMEKRDMLLPCQAECPAHTDIPRYIRYVKEGKLTEAEAVIHEKLLFPECLGRVCARPCESKCRRAELNSAVSIRNIKRYAAENGGAELWKKNSKFLPATGKKVCVVGGGPAGLTAAYYLKKQGHDVTLKEQFPKFGGQLQYGIPAYRMPREIVDKEVTYVAEAGVKMEANVKVDDPAALLEQFDAVLLAIGTHEGVRLPIAGSDLPGTMTGTDFLRMAAMGEETGMGNRIVVLGGGNVAFDCARTAVRLGAREVHLACRKAIDQMRADEEEIVQARAEGVQLHTSRTFERILGQTHVQGVELMHIKSYDFDQRGRAVIQTHPDSQHTIEADTVIFAVGQRTKLADQPGLDRGHNGAVMVRDSAKTSVEGLFACGDAVTGTKTVIQALVAGREAASEIDMYLGGNGDISEVLTAPEKPEAYIGQSEAFASLERKEPAILSASERINSFCSVDLGLDSTGACGEAERCLQCDLRFRIQPSRIWSEYNAEKGAGNDAVQ